MKIVDVNVLIYVASRQSELHAAVLRWWNDAIRGTSRVGLCWISITGFLRIMTHPRLLDQPLSMSDAKQCVDEWLALPNIQWIQELERHWEVFAEMLEDAGPGGNRVTDAHLAALAVSRGATLVSCDKGFSRFRRLQWENPAE